MLITAHRQQKTHHKDFVANEQCKHSDGYNHNNDDGNLHTETSVGTVAVTTVPIQPSPKELSGIIKGSANTIKKLNTNNRVQSKGNSKRSRNTKNDTKKIDSNIESHDRYAMEFPRHNWLLERLVSENKIDGQDVKQQERKLKEKMDQERDRKEKENLELERLNKKRRKLLRLERIKQREHHEQQQQQPSHEQQQQQQQQNQYLWKIQPKPSQQLLRLLQQQPTQIQEQQRREDLNSPPSNPKPARARSDSEIDMASPDEAKQNSLKRSLSFDALSNDTMNFKIMNVVSLSSHKTEQDLTSAMSPDGDTSLLPKAPVTKTLKESTDSKHVSNETESLQELLRKVSSATENEDIFDITPKMESETSPTIEDSETLVMESSSTNLIPSISGSNNKLATVFKPKIIHHQTEQNDLCGGGSTTEKGNPFLIKKKTLDSSDHSAGTMKDKVENPKEEIVDVLSIDDETPSAFKKSCKTPKIRDHDHKEDVDEENQTLDDDYERNHNQRSFDHLTHDPKPIPLFARRTSTASFEDDQKNVQLQHPTSMSLFQRDSSVTMDSNNRRSFAHSQNPKPIPLPFERDDNNQGSYKHLQHPKPTPFEQISPPLQFPTKPSILQSSFTYQKRFTLRPPGERSTARQPVPRLPTYMQTIQQSMPLSAMYKNKLRFADSIMESFIQDRKKKYSVAHQRTTVLPDRRGPGTVGSYRQLSQSSPYYTPQQQGSTSPLRNEQRMNATKEQPPLRSPTKNSFLMQLQRKHDEEYSTTQVNNNCYYRKISVSNILLMFNNSCSFDINLM